MLQYLLLLAVCTALVVGEAGYNYRPPSSGGNSFGFGGGLHSSGGHHSSGSGGYSSASLSSGIGGGFSGGFSSSGIGGGYSSGSSAGGYSSGSSAGGFSGYNLGGGGGVQKHIYVHVAPEEPQEQVYRAPIQARQPQKHYKIVFIKAPTPPSPTALSLPPPVQDISKTLIYVLVKKPEEAPEVEIPTAAPTQPSKPEVYFVRYKTQKSGGGSGYSSGGGYTSSAASSFGSSGSGSFGGSAGGSSGSFGASGLGGGYASGSAGSSASLSSSYGPPSGSSKGGY